MNFLSKIFNTTKTQNILIVDDTVDNVTLLEGYIEKIKGVKIYKSYNPFDAEKLLKTIDFSLLLLDIQMNEMDGYELATKIKYGKYGRNNDTPIIFITAIYETNEDKLKGYNIGSIDYIIKPIDNNIKNKVETYLNISEKSITIEKLNNIKKSINL